jgi:hypothetical protein
VVKHQFSKHNALSSIPSTGPGPDPNATKNRKEKKKERKKASKVILLRFHLFTN